MLHYMWTRMNVITLISPHFINKNNLGNTRDLSFLSCSTENQTGSNRFILVLQLMNWHSARSYCIQFHTDLAIIRSKEENDILTLTQGHNPTWIGLYRNSWRWSDGTNVSMSFFNWMSTTLHVFRQMRPCGAKVPKRLIEDQLCSNALPFICMHRKLHMKKLRYFADRYRTVSYVHGKQGLQVSIDLYQQSEISKHCCS